jgi:hypothetical protein
MRVVLTCIMGITDHYGQEAAEVEPFEQSPALQGGAVAGFVATVATSLVILAVDRAMFSDAIAGMYGVEDALMVGLIAHLLHGTLFGVVFAFVLSDPGLARLTDWLWKTSLAGVAYGLVLALVATGFLMPVWIDFVGVTEITSMPYVTTSLVGWHVLYGLVLGALFPFAVELELSTTNDK